MRLTETYNKQRLIKIINSSNVPIDNKECDDNSVRWFEGFKKTMVKYSENKTNSKTITYSQPVPETRLIANNGIQCFPREIRNYILTGDDGQPMYKDIDVVNCHPVILEQLFVLNGINKPEFIYKYNTDRKGTIKKLKFKDKLCCIKIINNSDLYYTDTIIKQFHNTLYRELIPILKKKEEFKQYIKKKKNQDGTFISYVLQYYENKILHSLVRGLEEQEHTTGILMFDGCMIENSDNELDLDAIVESISIDTGFDIELSEKPVKTDWIPNEDNKGHFVDFIKQIADTDSADEYNIEYSLELMDNNDKFMSYMNRYICMFDNPQCFGWRRFATDDYSLRTKISDRMGLKQFSKWSNLKDSKKYKGLCFKVEADKPDFLNLYKRPIQTKGETPLVFLEFLENIVCRGDAKVFAYMNQYIHTLITTGKTRQCIVMMGLKGTGKSTLIEILAEIVGKEYFTPVNDIQRLTSNFNSQFEKSIFIGIEEVVSAAGDYHKVQNILKSLITEDYKMIEKKGIDAYPVDCYNNIIISTNGANPVQITEDNRRYLVLDISNDRKGDHKYFKNLREYTTTNIEQIRHYFSHLEFENSLADNRPSTTKEKELLDLNITPIDRFIKEEMKIIEKVVYLEMYNEYSEYCKNIGENKQSSKYFSNAIKKAGYQTKKKGASNTTYILPL